MKILAAIFLCFAFVARLFAADLLVSASPGQTVTFSYSLAAGTPPFTQQWLKGGVPPPVPGTTGATLVLGNVQPADSGTYTVVIVNQWGSTVSNNAILTVAAIVSRPYFSSQPASQTAVVGSPVTFTSAAANNPTGYQWLKNGVPIAGATGPNLTLPVAALTDAATYSVTATNAGGTATSNSATLIVIGTAPAGGQLGASVR